MNQLLKIKDVSCQLGISEKTLRNKMWDGSWPIEPIRIGRLVRFRPEDVEKIASGAILVGSSKQGRRP